MTQDSNQIKLTPRLQLAADMARPGIPAADIGTDHAYIPAYLVRHKHCPHVIAADLRQGPLDNAAGTLEKYQIGSEVELRLCNGLDGIGAGEAYDIFICGMGGDMICDILSRAPWVKSKAYRLILQPMTRAAEVRRYLCGEGFDILEERAVREADHCYTVLCAGYTGYVYPTDEMFLHIGKLADSPDENARFYMLRQAQRLEAKARGMEKSTASTGGAQVFYELARKIRKILDYPPAGL